jgi:hypothetical protein
LPFQFVVAPVGTLLRRVAPRGVLFERSRRIQIADIVER